MRKVAIDIHGTIDADPPAFAELTRRLRDKGMEIHITTGVSESPELHEKLKGWGILYDKLFSITDYHKSIGTPIEWDEKGNPHIEECVWDCTKAEYCEREGIAIAIDDSEIYGQYFDTTCYLQYSSELEVFCE